MHKHFKFGYPCHIPSICKQNFFRKDKLELGIYLACSYPWQAVEEYIMIWTCQTCRRVKADSDCRASLLFPSHHDDFMQVKVRHIDILTGRAGLASLQVFPTMKDRRSRDCSLQVGSKLVSESLVFCDS